MKTLAVFAVICCAFVLNGITAIPVADLAADEPDVTVDFDLNPPDVLPEEPQRFVAADEVSSRQKRATCDLLSGFGVGSSACAAHCILRGNRGGYCNGKSVCVCRN